MRIKPGASIRGLRPETVVGLSIVEDILRGKNVDLVITEGTGGQHVKGSLHYVGLAADIRSNTLSKGDQVALVAAMQDALGSEFDVVLEEDHIHFEFQPKEAL